MFGLSFWEITVILVVALLVLGPQKLPQLLGTIGKAMREVRRASSGLREALEEPLDEIRRPLDEIRNEVAGAYRQAEHAVERQLDQETLTAGETPAQADSANSADALDHQDSGLPVPRPAEGTIAQGAMSQEAIDRLNASADELDALIGQPHRPADAAPLIPPPSDEPTANAAAHTNTKRDD
ncbi:MAG: twin-arginine translocase TatA/TatE family subunit [Deltaproteobacteria bacterium]|nr:twin-arginine translocase TatA/TatE family subunit [Deltaproteobacteria bacterium]